MSKDKLSDKAGDFSKNIWLAGLGAYGKVFDEASEKYTKASKDMPKLFKDLVAKGEQLEVRAKEQVTEPLIKTSTNIEARIEKMRESLGFGRAEGAADIARLEAKLDQVIESVAALASEVNKIATSAEGSSPKVKPKAKPASAKRAAVEPKQKK